MTPTAFAVLAALLKERSGIALGPDKAYLLETRLAALLARERLSGLDELAQHLHGRAHSDLARDVVEAMTTNETLFFRDGYPFEHMRRETLPRLLAARPPGSTIRIWSAAASTGQEAYSLAMLIAELGALPGQRRIEILATDIAREQLARARTGLYTQFEVQRGLPVHLLLRYFRQEDTRWRMSERIRSMVEFREWNLLDDPRPLGTFDVVFCRNVLIYFEPATKERALAGIARVLPPDGLLYLGAAETVVGLTSRFDLAAGERGVYRPVMAGAVQTPGATVACTSRIAPAAATAGRTG